MNYRQFILRVVLAAITFTLGTVAVWLHTTWSAGRPSSDVEIGITSPAPNTGQSQDEVTDPISCSGLRNFPDVWDSQSTIAGQLEITENNSLDWKVTLNGKRILAERHTLPPRILTRLQQNIGPYNEVLVLTREGGTCCEITRFWFLGLKADGLHFLSKKIDGGWVEEPHITAGKDYVEARIKGGPENHGDGYLPGGVWIFQNRTVRKVK